jgi:hypothetical protein
LLAWHLLAWHFLAGVSGIISGHAADSLRNSEFDAHRLLILKSRQNRSRLRGFRGVDELAAATDAFLRPYLLLALTDGISQ